LGVLYLSDEFGRSILELLKKEFERTGGITKAEAYDSKETDFKEHITRLKDTEAIYAVGFTSHLTNVFKQLREENFRGSILGPSTATLPVVRSISEANGVYVAAPIIYNPNFLFAQEVKKKYEDRYGKPFNHYAATGYDFMKILAGLLEDKEISRQSVKRVLEEGFMYSGIFGSLDVKPGEHDIIFPLYPAEIVDGEVRYR
jgi:ABC-type branched-subunit amino acid transport system substrate-binding protein